MDWTAPPTQMHMLKPYEALTSNAMVFGGGAFEK